MEASRVPAFSRIGGWSAWIAIAATAFVAAPGRAGDHHRNANLRCSDCHVMHYSQNHGYDLRGGFLGNATLGHGPQRHLLRNSVNELCLSCHDGNPNAADVLGAENTGSQPTSVRLGGFLNRVGAAGAVGNGHTLDALDVAPGSQPMWSPQDENGPGQGLTCTNCHDPHGAVRSTHPSGSQYRNLRENPGWGSRLDVTYNATPGVNDLLRDVFVRRSLRYHEADVDWNEPDDQDSAIARWCGGCHSMVHDNVLSGGGSGFGAGGSLIRHPVFKEDLDNDMVDRQNALTNRVKVMSEVGIWYPVGRDATPTCITCHKAHGNGNPRGLIFRSGTGALTENGDTNGTSREDLCRQCHLNEPVIGSSFRGAGAPARRASPLTPIR